MLSRTELDSRVNQLTPSGTFAGFEVLGRLSTGGMAEILLARSPASRDSGARPVIIKRILPHYKQDPTYRAMFESELGITRRLDHSHVPHLLDAGMDQEFPFMVLEWIDGIPLERLLASKKKKTSISVNSALHILVSIAEALDYVHKLCDNKGSPLQLIHRDVSPHNIIVGFLGEVSLLDFGIAKAKNQRNKTLTGVVKGNFAYTSPEQCKSEALDQRVDIFALGVCVVEILLGKSPFRRATWPATMQAIVNDPMPSLCSIRSDVSPNLEALLGKVLAKNPANRFSSAKDIIDAVKEISGTTKLQEKGKEELQGLLAQLFSDELSKGPKLETFGGGS